LRVFCGKPASEGPPSLGGFDSICGGLLDGYYSIYNFNVSPPNLRQAVLIKVLNSINYMNKDLAAVTAVWRALHWVRGRRFGCFICVLIVLLSKNRRRCFAADYGPSLETGTVFDALLSVNYCAILDWVSVRAVQEKCDEKADREARKTPCERRPWNPTLFAKCAKRMGHPAISSICTGLRATFLRLPLRESLGCVNEQVSSKNRVGELIHQRERIAWAHFDSDMY